MLSLILGIAGPVVGLIGWFKFRSLILLAIGVILVLIESYMERQVLNSNAAITEVCIFLIGCLVGLFTATPSYIMGMIFFTVYHGIVALFTIVWVYAMAHPPKY